jgi:hypothetical protein
MTSMHRPAERSHVPLHLGVVVLAAQPTKDIHHSTLGRFLERTKGYVLSLVQQRFSFRHFLISKFPSGYVT